MPFPLARSAALGAALLGAVGLTAFLSEPASGDPAFQTAALPSPADAIATVDEASPEPDRVPSPGRAEAPAGKVEQEVSPTSPPDRTVRTVSASVRQVLPGIEHAVADWRTFKPEVVTVAPYPDLPMDFEAASVREESGRTVWSGRNALTGAFLVSAATAGEWHAVLTIPGASTFEVHIRGQEATVQEKIPEADYCGTELFVHEADASTMPSAEPEPSASPAPDGARHLVDVLFFYDADALAIAGSAESLQTRIISLVASSNLVLENSEVDEFQWVFAGAYQVPEYPKPEKMQDDLERITSTSNSTGRFVQERAQSDGADQVVLFVGARRDFGGIAWTPGYHSVVYWRNGFMTLAHELGHNFGCRHDRQKEEIPDSDTRYNFGHRYVASGRDTGTIMSYADWPVPYFSNPEVTHQGQPLGIAQGQPKAAHNTRVLAGGAAGMAAHRVSTSAPRITEQPLPVAINVGESFTLSVLAVGERLAYQWRRNGVALPGATESTFVKLDAGTDDAGTYSVVVSNPSGQAVSSGATVTVRERSSQPPAAATTSSTSSGSSGGGGGGSTDCWFALSLAALLLGRCAQRSAR